MLAIIALIVLGPKRLPEAARSLGKGMREMRDSFQGMGDDDEENRHLDAADVEPDPESGAEDLPDLPEELHTPEEKGQPTAKPEKETAAKPEKETAPPPPTPAPAATSD